MVCAVVDALQASFRYRSGAGNTARGSRSGGAGNGRYLTPRPTYLSEKFGKQPPRNFAKELVIHYFSDPLWGCAPASLRELGDSVSSEGEPARPFASCREPQPGRGAGSTPVMA